MHGKKQLSKARFQQVLADDVLRSAMAGDMAAHGEIYKMFSQAVLTLACGFCKNQQAAEDVLHNTFVKLIQKITLFENRAPFGMWLRSIAVNESLAYLRKHKKHNATLSTDEYAFLDSVNELPEVMSLKTSACDFADQIGKQSDLGNLLNELPEHVRLIVWLKEVEGYTHEEIAKLVDKTPSYSKSLVARTYKFMRGRIEVRNKAQSIAV